MAVKKETRKKKESRGLARFYRETVGELNKVSWPTRQEATNLTIIVLIVMIAMSIFLWVVDLIATQLLSLGLSIGA